MAQATGRAEPAAPGAPDPGSGRAIGVYARALRWSAPAVVALWIAGTVAAVILVPPLNVQGRGPELGGSINPGARPIQAQIKGVRTFGFPLLAQNVVVQHKRSGLSLAAQARTVMSAVRLDTQKVPGLGQIAAAIPVTNQNHLVPSSSQSGTTALTYLFYRPSIPVGRTAELSDEYARRFLSTPQAGLVGVTGAFQAEQQQGHNISSSLDIVEYLSVVLLLLVVGVTFRSVVAPLLTLLTAGMAYELSQRILSLATLHLGVTVPTELDPIIVVLLLGIVTDYSVFYLSALRRRLHSGDATRDSATRATREVTPLVLAAGITVAGGVSLIATARLALFSALAPGLAITVAVALLMVVSFLPAALHLLRSLALWPSARRAAGEPRRRRRIQEAITRPVVAVALMAVALSGLGYLVHSLRSFGIGIDLIGDLPASSQVVRADRAATSGFAAGIVEPTEMIVSGPTPTGKAQLDGLQQRVGRDPAVAGVIGPANEPGFLPKDVFAANGGRAARYLIVFRRPPLGASAIRELSHLESAMPRLLAGSGMPGWTAAWAGDTALSRSIVHPSRWDLLQVGLLTVATDLVVSLILLRSVVAPLVLTVSSALVVAAALGVTLLVFPSAGGEAGMTFYVPFACEVLLLSFGADYNMFLAGEIWHQSTQRPFKAAVARGGAQAAAAINVAGLTLALSFAVLAVVPLRAFREIAVCMGAGLLIDTFVVRFLLVPTVLSLIGPAAMWPGRHPRHGATSGEAGKPTLVPDRKENPQ